MDLTDGTDRDILLFGRWFSEFNNFVDDLKDTTNYFQNGFNHNRKTSFFFLPEITNYDGGQGNKGVNDLS